MVSTLEEVSEDSSPSSLSFLKSVNYISSRTHCTPSPKTPVILILLTGKAGLELLHLPLRHKLLNPSDSHVVLHGEGDEGGGQVAGEGKALSVKLYRVENEKTCLVEDIMMGLFHWLEFSLLSPAWIISSSIS